MKGKRNVNVELEKRDRFFYLDENGDQSYAKKHNDFVMAQVIKQTDAKMREKERLQVEAYGERADAVVHYLKAVGRGKEPNIPKYFGKKYLAYLRGDQIRSELMSGLTLIKNAQKK